MKMSKTSLFRCC